MGAQTGVEWADRTFSPWWGCQEVSTGCTNCYAKTWAKRWGRNTLWGARGRREPVSESTWGDPVKWDKQAAAAGRVDLTFCASMADVFEDHPDVVSLRKRLWELVYRTPNLIWMIPTKRPENVLDMVPQDWATYGMISWPGNVWIGTSVENDQTAAQRLNHLRRVPAPVRFVSAEPLLGPVDLTPWLSCAHESLTGANEHPATLWQCDHCHALFTDEQRGTPITSPQLVNWVITGGESGNNKRVRPAHPDWVRQIRDDCAANGVPFFFKQWGEYLPVVLEDAPEFAGGRAFTNPKTGNRVAAVMWPLATHWGGQTERRPLQAGDVNGHGQMLDDNTIAIRVGKKNAGALLDGVEHRDFPAAARRKDTA